MIQYNREIRNTFGIKVRSAAYAEWGSEDELRELLRNGSLPRPLLFVGAGSNLLFTGDFPGTVLHSEMKDIRILSGAGADGGSDSVSDSVSGEFGSGNGGNSEVLVEAGSGVVFDDFCAWAAERGLWGVENLSHIPGEVGASAVQNVGAYGVEAKDVIVKLNCIELSTGNSVVFDNADCGYGYRASNFKTLWKGLYAVTSVVFRLSSVPAPRLDYGHLRSAVEAVQGLVGTAHESDAASASADETAHTTAGGTPSQPCRWKPLTPSLVREVVTGIRRQKLPEPSELGSAGSFFKNPVIPQEQFDRILADFRLANGQEAAVPHYVVEQSGGESPMIKVPAAWMIEQCGWKGRQLGNVACYSRQPLVIVNLTGNAAPQEVIDLENAVISSVRARFGVELHPEVEHI